MEINVLIDSGEENSDYLRIFKPNFLVLQSPDKDWLEHFTFYISKAESLELFNHYLIWLKALQELRPQVILYNSTLPNLPDSLFLELIKSPSQLLDQPDLLLYGKYSDLCCQYKEITQIRVPGRSFQFSIYETKSPYGGYAYYVTPEGAQKLMRMILEKPVPIDQIIHRLAKIGNVLTFHPSLVVQKKVSYECRSSEIQRQMNGWIVLLWFLVFLLLFAFFIGLGFYFASSGFQYRPGKKIPISYSSPSNLSRI